VLEFDGGLSRAEAEERALADISEELAGCGGHARGILGELIRADAQRHAPALEEAVQALGLAGVRAPLWGFGHVVAEQGTWRPDGRMLTRRGLVDLLGRDELEAARDCGDPLLVFGDVLAWLKGHSRGAVLLDWQQAHRQLDGLAALFCSERTAPLLHRATRRCRPVPTIAVPRRGQARHAA
jgi:hypothetical protein